MDEEEKEQNPGTARIRICESEYHKQVKLTKFQPCPICKSRSVHKTIIVKEKIKKEEIEEEIEDEQKE